MHHGPCAMHHGPCGMVPRPCTMRDEGSPEPRAEGAPGLAWPRPGCFPTPPPPPPPNTSSGGGEDPPTPTTLPPGRGSGHGRGGPPGRGGCGPPRTPGAEPSDSWKAYSWKASPAVLLQAQEASPCASAALCASAATGPVAAERIEAFPAASLRQDRRPLSLRHRSPATATTISLLLSLGGCDTIAVSGRRAFEHGEV